jgi:hypothetical protein
MINEEIINKEEYDKETVLIKQLESTKTDTMSEREKMLHRVAFSDAYWRRRMSQRTPEEVAAGI